jgi:hypothetical protein
MVSVTPGHRGKRLGRVVTAAVLLAIWAVESFRRCLLYFIRDDL